MFSSINSDWRKYGSAWLLTALVVMFGMQELRVLFVGFVGYLRDSVGMGSLSLAPVALSVFALSFLAGVLNRFAGTRNALWITAGGLALVRLAEQFSHAPALDLYLSVAATALFLMYIPLAIGIARAKGGEDPSHLALAVLFGLSIDSALQLAARTLDLSWQPGILPPVVVGAFTLILFWALRQQAADVPQATDGTWRQNLALLAFGPWLFLQLQIFQNTAVYSTLTGWETPAAGALLILGNALALYVAAQAVWPPRSWVNVLLVGFLALVPITMLFPGNLLIILWLLFGQVFSLTLGFFLVLAACGEKGNKGLLRSSVLNGFGHILFVLFVFLYYSSYDINFGFGASLLPPVALVLTTLLVAIAFQSKNAKRTAIKRNYTPAISAAVLLIVPLVLQLTWKPLTAVAAPAEVASVRVMDYNLHDAVNTDGVVDPEALARIIEDSGADIVGLQEISRGWLVWGGMDMLTWLSQRLEMPYVWDATADAQWGMAILSRYPIVSVERFDLPPEDIQLPRGFSVAQVDVGGQVLTVINTHFSEKDDQDEIRTMQASAIVGTWNNAETTVIMGDFNALPDSQAIELLLGAGLVDISREIGTPPTFTYSSFNPDHQIDYIFVTPDLGYRDFVIYPTTASDHLPLAVTIELP